MFLILFLFITDFLDEKNCRLSYYPSKDSEDDVRVVLDVDDISIFEAYCKARANPKNTEDLIEDFLKEVRNNQGIKEYKKEKEY